MERGCGYWFLRYVLGGFENSCEEVRTSRSRLRDWREDEIKRDDTLKYFHVIYNWFTIMSRTPTYLTVAFIVRKVCASQSGL
jgi:hypothetical protein